MEIRNFEEDLEESNNPILRNNWIKIFKNKFGEDIEIIWKDELSTQKGLGTDLTIKTSKGRRYSVELKARSSTLLEKDKYIFEIKHWYYNKDPREVDKKVIGSKEGWLYNTTAEYIFHATVNWKTYEIEDVIFYSLYPFKTEKYKEEINKLTCDKRNLLCWNNLPNYKTVNVLIPKEKIKQDATEFWERTK